MFLRATPLGLHLDLRPRRAARAPKSDIFFFPKSEDVLHVALHAGRCQSDAVGEGL